MKLHTEPKEVIVVFHPGKERTLAAKRANAQLKVMRWQKTGRVVEEVETNPDAAKTVADIRDMLDKFPGAVVFPKGGDGTINSVITAQQEQTSPHRSGMLLGPNGSANDGSHNHNSALAGYSLRQAHRALSREPDVTYPMKLVLTPPGGEPVTHYAGNNLGFGYTADFAERIDGEAYRKSWLQKFRFVGGVALLDQWNMFQSLGDLRAYQSDDAALGSLSLVDRSLVHAELAAKHGHFPISHRQPDYFFDMRSRQPNAATIVLAGARMLTGTVVGDHTPSVSFTNGDRNIRAHKDGEVFDVPAGAQVEVTVSQTPLLIYGTRSANPPADSLPTMA